MPSVHAGHESPVMLAVCVYLQCRDTPHPTKAGHRVACKQIRWQPLKKGLCHKLPEHGMAAGIRDPTPMGHALQRRLARVLQPHEVVAARRVRPRVARLPAVAIVELVRRCSRAALHRTALG